MSEQHHSLYDNSQYPPRQRPTPPERGSQRKRPRRSGGRRWLRILGTLLLIAITTGTLLCCFGAVYISTVIMPIAKQFRIEDFDASENSVMYYQNKATGEYEELVTLLSSTNATWVDFEDIPEDLKNAAIAIEDRRFESHHGVDWLRTARAVMAMFTGGDIMGGSTITQQLIKNLTDYNETTVKRKIVEICRAMEFDKNYTKDFTLEWYLNIIPLGSGCEGVGAAALEYFGKPVSELSLAECASLISITNNPSKYGPYSSARVATESGELWTAKQWNKWRQENVLLQMQKQGMISEREYATAVAEELVFCREEGTSEEGTIYSWYEEQVISDVRDDLIATYGYSETMVERMLSQGGLRIYTCLDPEVQAAAEAIYENRANLNYTSSSGSLMQSAITVIDNHTGDVAAIVGRVGEKDGNRWKNFATDTYRQPGSSIKPLSVYAPALDLGLITPGTVVDDYPYEVMNGRAWPVNSGSARYRGLTTVRYGVAQSVNTVALRVLADYVGVDKSFQFMEERFKIDLEEHRMVNGEAKTDKARAPLAMGGLTDGVNTRDMAEAYAVFPNDGVYRASRTYTKVTQITSGTEVVLLDNQSTKEQVIKASTAYYMNSLLQGVTTSGGTAGSAKLSGMATAGKTGTTSENYDRWFVGYTPYYTAAVWTGYEYNEKMSGANRAVSMWKLVMSEIHEGLSGKSFTTPEGLSSVSLCLDSGLRATEHCAMDPRGSRVTSERLFQEDIPSEYCGCHTSTSVVTICTAQEPQEGEGEAEADTAWHLAGEYCPEESVKEYCMVEYDRKSVGGAAAADSAYLYSAVSGCGTCTVHTEPEPLFPFWPFVDPDGEEGTGGEEEPQVPGGDREEDPERPPEADPEKPPVENGEENREEGQDRHEPPPSQDIKFW